MENLRLKGKTISIFRKLFIFEAVYYLEFLQVIFIFKNLF